MTTILQEARELCDKATPGPWRFDGRHVVQLSDAGKGYPVDYYPDCADVVTCDGADRIVATDADLSFIAASRQLVPQLLSECERLTKENEWLKAIHRGSRARLIVAASAADDASRCAVCGWPLVASAVDGCVRGNCFERPRPKNLYAPERAARELLKNGVTP